MTCSVMQRQIKMQVYHRGYYTCSLFGLLCILLRLPFLPLQLHLGITLQMQSNYSQMSSETATEGLLRAASGQESTHTTVTNATGHCHFSLLTKGHLLVTRLQRCLSTSTAAQGCYFAEEVFTFIWVYLCFPLPCWGPAGWQTHPPASQDSLQSLCTSFGFLHV